MAFFLLTVALSLFEGLCAFNLDSVAQKKVCGASDKLSTNVFVVRLERILPSRCGSWPGGGRVKVLARSLPPLSLGAVLRGKVVQLIGRGSLAAN